MQRVSARQMVGWYEIAGGVIGVGATVFFAPGLLMSVPAQHRVQTLVVMVISAACFALVAFAGVLLLQRHRLGLPLSIAVQIAQIPMWTLLGTVWAFTAGPYATPTLSQAGVGLLLGVTVRWTIQIRDAVGPSWVGLNLVPIAVLLLLRETLRERQRDNGGSLPQPEGTMRNPGVADIGQPSSRHD